MLFTDLALDDALVKAVAAEGYTTPTPIQQKAIPHVLAGRDLIGVAQTGTGKTAAFALPILHRLLRGEKHPRVIRTLVLSPTRELAAQIAASFTAYGANTSLKNSVIFGGVGQEPQVRALRAGVDILVATPGRLLDLMDQGLVRLDGLEIFVLDEADRMLDMGFIHDVKRVIRVLPKKRQTLLFSATMPDDIEELARQILIEPQRVAVAPPSTTVEIIAQSLFFVEQAQKRGLLLHLMKDPAASRVIAFTRTKHGANRVAEFLEKNGIGAAPIHGNKSQSARERALAGFKQGSIRVLVATDIAARGIDVDGITHVIQIDLPEVPEQYVHRIGRTARAGAGGSAWAFCASDERPLLRDIERAIRRQIDVVADHPFVGVTTAGPAFSDREDDRGGQARRPRMGRGGGRGGGGGGGGRDNRGYGGRGGAGRR